MNLMHDIRIESLLALSMGKGGATPKLLGGPNVRAAGAPYEFGCVDWTMLL